MKADISVLMITKNAGSTIVRSLRSVFDWTNEIIVVDSFSADNTLEIAKKYKASIYPHIYKGEGKQRAYALEKVRSSWVLVLDDDEVVTLQLRKEILKMIRSSEFSGYNIPFQSHYCGRKINFGGENYHKMILFKKNSAYATDDEIHAIYKLKDKKIGMLTNKVDHYSYRSLWQLFSKFTDYAKRDARQRKNSGESTSLKKIIFYPPHMFWSRFIKDKGYKDGFFRLPLDLAFAYYEFMKYLLMLWI